MSTYLQRRRTPGFLTETVGALDVDTYPDGFVTPGDPASAPDAIAALAFRNDGLTGATVAGYSLPFDPGAVSPSQVANLTAWIGGTEVALYVEDRGARHYPDAPTSVAEVWVEHAIAPSVANQQVPVTYRLDVAPTVTRRTRASYTPIANSITLAVGSNPANLTAPGVKYFHRNDDSVRITGAGETTWDTARTGATITPNGTTGTHILCGLYAKADGSLVAMPNHVEDGGIYDLDYQATNFCPYVPNASDAQGLDTDRHLIAVFLVALAAGSGAHTFGTSALNRTGVTFTSSPTTSPTLFPVYPQDIPVASGTLATVAARCSASMTPWKIEPASLSSSLDANAVALEQQHAQNLDDQFQRLGTFCTFAANAFTTYGPCSMGYEAHARYGPIRYLRHAMAAWSPWRTIVATSGGLTNPNDGHPMTLPGNEAGSDPTVPMWTALLTRHPTAELELEDTLLGQERYTFQTFDNDSDGQPDVLETGTGRGCMHIFEGLALLHRLGYTTRPGWAITGRNSADTWYVAAPVGTTQRLQRACDWVKHYMQAKADQPGLRRLNLAAYGGCGPFMQGRITDSARIACRTIGLVDAAFDTAIADAITYMFEATRNVTNGLGTGRLLYYNTNPGLEAFPYSEDFSVDGEPPGARMVTTTAADCHESPVLNGCHAGTLAWRIATTSGATRTTWLGYAKAVMDAILSEPRSTTGTRGKTVAEIGLHLGMLHYARRHLSLD